MVEATKASFGLANYKVYEAEIKLPREQDFNLQVESSFEASGKFNGAKGIFELEFKVTVHKKENIQDYIFKAAIIAYFKFNTPLKKEEIPDFFYGNSIAIVFPYVRAFLTSLSIQGNNRPYILPLLNLSNLEKPLRENTVEVSDTPSGTDVSPSAIQ
jgi:preprotein translocase subunit SecB